MENKVRIGVIGCGSIGRTHLQYLASRNDVELVAVCDIIEARAKQYGTEFGAKWYTDYRNLLSDDRIDVIFVLTPTGSHAEIVIAAAQNGKHIFCEKPMAMKVAECKAMRKAIEQASVIFQTGYVLRFSNHILKVKEWLTLIGRPALFRDVWAPSPWASPHPWVFDKNIGGGPLYEASHWIDLMNFLFGRPKKVYATMHHFKPGRFTAPDTFIVIDYEAGDRALWSDTECIPGFGDFYICHTTTRPHLSIIGPKGSICFPSCDGSKVAVLYLNHMGVQPVETHPWESDWRASAKAYQAELDYFLECVKNGRQPSVNTAEDGEWVIQVIEAALLSHERGQPVQLPLEAWHQDIPVNSREWWDNYFASQWEANKGSEQTHYHMELILSRLPIPESVYLRSKSLSILDWGCAFGEGTNLLALFFPNSQVTGLDFAPRAIEEARRRYPHLEFILTAQGEIPHAFDVIVTSHTLEHFENPLAKAKEQLEACNDLYIVLVPYDEHPLPEYHRSQFREESFPERLGGFVRIHAQIITDTPYGKQLLIIYGSRSYLQKRPNVVADIRSEREKWDKYYASLPLLEEDEAIKEFNKEFVERVSELLPPGSKILEAGCGAGWQSLALARLGKYDVSLMDFSQEALKYVQKIFAKEGLQGNFIYGDVFTPGKPEYDLVFNAGVLEHYIFDQQVAFLKGMASRSRKYALVLVPNRQCYWYWLWRVQRSSEGNWPFGKEAPAVDLSEVFKAAGLRFIGQRFMGDTWTEEFINSFKGLDKEVHRQILEIHRSPLIPKSQKSYLVAALGSVLSEAPIVPVGWEVAPQYGDYETAQAYAALADALALRIGSEQQLQTLQAHLAKREQGIQDLRAQLGEKERQLQTLQAHLAEREQKIQDLRAQLGEKEKLLHIIYSSRGFRIVARIWELRGAWRSGRRNLIKSIVRPVFWKLPPKIRALIGIIYIRFLRPPTQSSPTKPALSQLEHFTKIQQRSANFRVGKPGLVSVVLPVYNQASYLRESILSVLQQTYEDFELIIVDDGSTDDIEPILEEFADHPKVLILRHSNNQGLPKALSTGFNFAQGEFWTWTSADNLMLPQQLERHVTFLQSHPDVAMVYSDYIAIDDEGNPLRDPRFRPHNRESPTSPVIRLPRAPQQLNTVKDNFIGPCFMYRGWVGRLIGDYDPLFLGAEDYDYWMRINNLFRIAHLGTDELLYKYRVHNNTLNARASELGIFERVDHLMTYEVQRREFYKQTFTFYVDEVIGQWLKEELHKGGFTDHCYPLSECYPSNEEFHKTLIIISEASKQWLESFSPQPTSFVVVKLNKGSTLPYELEAELAAKVDLYVASDSTAYHRCALFTNKVFLIDEDSDLLQLVIAAANNAIYYRLTHNESATQRPKPIIYVPKKCKIKILLQVDNFDKGGLERVVYDLAYHLDHIHFDPTILITKHSGLLARRALAAGIKVLELPATKQEDAYREILSSIDIVNAHYSTSYLEIAAARGIPVVQTIHNSYVWLTPDSIARYQETEHYTKKYVAVSSSVAKYADVKLGLDVKLMTVINNGINIEELGSMFNEVSRVKIRRAYGLSEQDFVFLCTSAFYSHKGHLQVVEALAKLIFRIPQLKVMFVGEAIDVNYYERVKQRVQDLNLEKHVIFAGFQENPYDFYRAADAFLLPSFWEGWSLALAEALYFGLPVIATDVGASRELICETKLGILIPPPFYDITELDYTNIDLYLMGKKGDHGSFLQVLTKAMQKCFESTYTDTERATAHQIIVEKYNAKRMASDYSRLFLELAPKPFTSWEEHKPIWKKPT